MYATFKLFQSHLDLAHTYWKMLIQKGDCVIDATCGNGYDALVLANLSLTDSSGTLFCCDIEPKAIENTRTLLSSHLNEETMQRIQYIQGCHSQIHILAFPQKPKLIVYNLGFLPRGDKSKTTRVETTLESVHASLELLEVGGAISLTCYPGHEEGKREQEALLQTLHQLPPQEWSVCHHCWINRNQSPSLIFLQKKLSVAK